MSEEDFNRAEKLGLSISPEHPVAAKSDLPQSEETGY